MATADQYIEKAASYIGISGTDNIFNTWYWGRHVHDPYTYPWCAAFQSYVGVHDLGMPFTASASAAGVATQGTRVADEEARKGDWVLFNWDGRQEWGWADHIGVVEWSDINGSGYFGTIEGNTGLSAGGEVARCTRYNFGSYATSFWRPPYDGAPAPEPPSPEPEAVKFRIRQGGKWLGENETGERGKPIQGIAIAMPGWYQVCTRDHGWLERVDGYNVDDEENGFAGWNDSPVIAVRCYYSTPEPATQYLYARYRVSDVGADWWPWQTDDEVDANQDGYAGDYRPIDRFELKIV